MQIPIFINLAFAFGRDKNNPERDRKKHIAMGAVLCYFYFDWDILHIGLL